MADPYYIDLEQFSLTRFQQILESEELLPGRRILKEELGERFKILASMGITNMKELTGALKTRRQVENFVQASGLPREYVVILRREANSYLPKPVNLRDIPGIKPDTVHRLAALGIKYTKHLFDRGRSMSDRAELSRLAGTPEDELLELLGLADLARISGVGPVFARILYDAGYKSLAQLAVSSPAEVYDRLVALNEEKEFTRAKFTVKDVRFCVDTAMELPKVIEFW